ncbi:MAG TPA: alpha/beta fold hydrolase [Ottowia sp.]|uniref:alpha/beta hydrolase n=1 Tax=Ottowia sp. TaxID=1898956 RepID=UPI002BED226F|nr:alpha/beta hydrolase [Ottowia sp.]HMN21906.1 alpha/beta fold hydrolase [Ottowia sp.]
MALQAARRLNRIAGALVAVALLGGCAIVREFEPVVAVQPVSPQEYIEQRRGDMLTTGEPSAPTVETLRVAGLDGAACSVSWSLDCLAALAQVDGLGDERRLSALAELWLQRAMLATGAAAGAAPDAGSTGPWLEVARHAYAYLFFTERTPGARAFEDRQTQVRDWYNYAVQQAVTRLFDARRVPPGSAPSEPRIVAGDWVLRLDARTHAPGAGELPMELLPASGLAFSGLRSIYRRDGFGAELVAVLPVRVHRSEWAMGAGGAALPLDWSELPTRSRTVLLRFEAGSLEQLLSTREAVLALHDPLLESAVTLHGQPVPLAGNFSAAPGVWLARSDFGRQSLRSLLGRGQGLDHPQLYLLQPYDPQRRVIVLLHGLASSPEAWVNVANELLGDEALRRGFQAWLVHYPTNLPLAANHAAIRALLQHARCQLDPTGQAPATHGVVVIGHSMGGILVRLMVSSADRQLWHWAEAELGIDPARLEGGQTGLDPVLRFEPMDGVGRVIFIATPHRGTAVAEQTLARWFSGLIRLPFNFVDAFGQALQTRAATPAADSVLARLPNSIDQLSEHDPFVQAAAALPISDRIDYHSIIARLHTEGALESSDDGLVPYRSAHLAGSTSERVIVSGHSVQESAAAILEIRRILHEDLAASAARQPAAGVAHCAPVHEPSR